MVAAQVVQIDALHGTYSIQEGHYPIIKDTACTGQSIRCNFDQDDSSEYYETFRGNNCESVVTRDILPSLEYSANLKHKLETGIQILDIGCGTGVNTVAFARKYPKSNLTGLDNLDKSFKVAKERSDLEGIAYIHFVNEDAQNLPDDMTDKYDLVLMLDALHNLPDPHNALEEARRVLKPDGNIMIYDPGVHSNHSDNVGDMTASFLYTCSTFFCLPCSLSGKSTVGYGVGRGEEETMKAVGSYFTFENKYEYNNLCGLYIYSK